MSDTILGGPDVPDEKTIAERLAKVNELEQRPRIEFAEPWVRADTGAQLTLSREDYLADDWEVQP